VRGALFVNPNSGGASSRVDEVLAEASRLGISVHVLGPGDDLADLARTAEADVLGMAGGDGSLGAVAGVAIERDLPFVAVPMGTRNHFAADAGIPSDDVEQLLAPFVHGEERRVDVGRANGRLFLNNVSLGLYARVVHEREQRRRRDVAFARLRALATSVADGGWHQTFTVDGLPVRASVLLIANNEYRLDVRTLGARERLDGGTLAVYAARGLRRLRWTERTTPTVRIETRQQSIRAAVDGEPERFASPLEVSIDPLALKLLVAVRTDGSDTHVS
jgi:diacylglycerol kinase family enzyme